MSGPQARRLGVQPGEEIDRETSFTFRLNGREVPAFAGDTIVSALLATGERVLSRSYKYHRPRGVLTASYLDPGCMVQVGDEPNVRGAHRLAEPRHGRAAPRTPGPRCASTSRRPTSSRAGSWPPASTTRRSSGRSGCGRPTRACCGGSCTPGTVSPDTPRVAVDKRYAHPDVLVAGGGPAGMTAAVAAAGPGRG